MVVVETSLLTLSLLISKISRNDGPSGARNAVIAVGAKKFSPFFQFLEHSHDSVYSEGWVWEECVRVHVNEGALLLLQLQLYSLYITISSVVFA